LLGECLEFDQIALFGHEGIDLFCEQGKVGLDGIGIKVKECYLFHGHCWRGKE